MKKYPLAIASGGAFIAALSTSLVAVSVPVIAKDLGTTPAEASWVLSSYLLAISCLLALSGKAADVLGRKRVYLTCFGFFSVGSALCATAPLFRALIGARVLQGVGAAMLMAVGPAIVTTAVPPSRRARALGIQLGATYFGLTLGPGLGGILASRLGWQAVFVVTAGAAAIGLACAIAWLEPDETGRTRPGIASLDLGGAVLFGGAIAALLVALRRSQREGFPGTTVLVAVALVALAVFVRHERIHRTPLLPLEMFSKRAFSLGIVGALVLYVVTFMLSYLLPFHLQKTLGLGPATAGAYMTSQPAVMAVVAPFSGVIADRWGARGPTVAGMLSIAAGLLGVTQSAPGIWLVVSLGFVGLGAGLYVAPNSALIMGSAPRERQSTASAAMATARNLGMTFGIATAASLDHTLGFVGALIAAAVIAVASAVLGAIR